MAESVLYWNDRFPNGFGDTGCLVSGLLTRLLYRDVFTGWDFRNVGDGQVRARFYVTTGWRCTLAADVAALLDIAGPSGVRKRLAGRPQ